MKSLKWAFGIGLLWIVLAFVVREMADTTWALSWVISGAFTYIFILQYKLDSLTSMFTIADAELVRVSALANRLESDVTDLSLDVERSRDDISR